MGAEHYDEMCVECHLAPGKEENELRAGLNPKPPKLAAPGDHRTPEHDFWIIKHGIKMTAMPAWGVTHDDRSIWAMTTFVQKLPASRARNTTCSSRTAARRATRTKAANTTTTTEIVRAG
jgi:mono/diheme cytochrome c family protein